MQGININVKSQEATHTDLNILVFFLFQTVLNYTKYYKNLVLEISYTIHMIQYNLM